MYTINYIKLSFAALLVVDHHVKHAVKSNELWREYVLNLIM